MNDPRTQLKVAVRAILEAGTSVPATIDMFASVLLELGFRDEADAIADVAYAADRLPKVRQ